MLTRPLVVPSILIMLDTVGSRLEDLCHRAGLSFRGADDLARRTPGHCQAIVRGTIRAAEAVTLLAYARVLGASLDWLISGEGTAPSDDAVRAAVELARTARNAVEVLHDATHEPVRGAA